MRKANVCGCVLALATALTLAAPALAGGTGGSTVAPSADLELSPLAGEVCSALVLPPAETETQRLQNQQLRDSFLAWRSSVSVEPTCGISTDSDLTNMASTDPLVCGDCPTCLSAASCLGCAVGAVCSKPGAVPTRACRSVKTCSGNVRCCGCS